MFKSHFGKSMCKRMPLGLKNTSATFQRAVDIALSPLKWKLSLIYFEDIITFSQSANDHFGHLIPVVSIMKNAGVLDKE